MGGGSGDALGGGGVGGRGLVSKKHIACVFFFLFLSSLVKALSTRRNHNSPWEGGSRLILHGIAKALLPSLGTGYWLAYRKGSWILKWTLSPPRASPSRFSSK